MTSTSIEEPLLDPKTAAELLNVPLPTLTTWRAQRSGPRYFRVGRHVRYRRRDLEEWLSERANARRGGSMP